jgi:hypothetical protein
MNMNVSYETVTEAINELAGKGYTIDFNLKENCPANGEGKFDWSGFTITGIYRYEGDSDPADEMIIYAIASDTGLKGTLISGYGVSDDGRVDAIIKQLNNQ